MPHEITTDDAGIKHGTDGVVTVTLLDGGRMFKRRAIKGVGTETPSEENWLVAELDGVRIYQQGMNVVVTKEDMYP